MELKKRSAAAWSAASDDNIGILAAGVAYYAFLAFVPLLAAGVLTYGLVVDPATVAEHVRALAGMLPQSAAGLIGEQLESMVETSGGAKGLGLLLALALALIGARNGAASIITAINMAYNRDESRSFVRGALVALLLTLGAVVGVGLVGAAIGAMTALDSIAAQAGTYMLLIVAAIGGAALLYRYATPGFRPGWHAVRPGALFAGAGLVLATLAFGIYVRNFGSYNATYGSLGAVVVLLTWLYLSAWVILFGAELNAAGRDTR